MAYRPTFAMSNERTGPALFRGMIEADVQWLFRLLPLCPDLRLLLTYGPIRRGDGRFDSLFKFVCNAALPFGYDIEERNGSTVLIHQDTWRRLVLHDGATRGEKCVNFSVVKNLHGNRERLTSIVEC